MHHGGRSQPASACHPLLPSRCHTSLSAPPPTGPYENGAPDSRRIPLRGVPKKARPHKLTPSAANPLSHIGFPYRTAYLGFCYGVSLSPSLGTPSSCGLSHFPWRAWSIEGVIERERERGAWNCLLLPPVASLVCSCLLLPSATASLLLLLPAASFRLQLPPLTCCLPSLASSCLVLPSATSYLPTPCLCVWALAKPPSLSLSLTHTLT